MNGLTTIKGRGPRALARFQGSGLPDDPVDPDRAGDLIVATSRRRLVRLTMVAAETGARFAREGVDQDPMAWLLAPRELFSGRTAIEACLEREPFVRALVLHALSLGMDAPAAAMDLLLSNAPPGGGPDDVPGRRGKGGDPGRGGPPGGRLRLYSATIVLARGGELLHAFHASMASCPQVIRERLRSRFGAVAAEHAQICMGFDTTSELAASLVPPAIRAVLADGAFGARWTSTAALDVTVEQRMPS